MVGFIIALVFGLFQMFLLSKLLRSATSGKTSRVVGFLILKMLVYVVAIGLLMLVFPSQFVNCACGYAAGLPLGAFIYFIYLNFVKKN